MRYLVACLLLITVITSASAQTATPTPTATRTPTPASTVTAWATPTLRPTSAPDPMIDWPDINTTVDELSVEAVQGWNTYIAGIWPTISAVLLLVLVVFGLMSVVLRLMGSDGSADE